MIKILDLVKVSTFVPNNTKAGDVLNNFVNLTSLFDEVDNHSDLVVIPHGSLSGIFDDKVSGMKIFYGDIKNNTREYMEKLLELMKNDNKKYSIIISEFSKVYLINVSLGIVELKDRKLCLGNKIIKFFYDFETIDEQVNVAIYFCTNNVGLSRSFVYSNEFTSVMSGLNDCGVIRVYLSDYSSDYYVGGGLTGYSFRGVELNDYALNVINTDDYYGSNLIVDCSREKDNTANITITPEYYNDPSVIGPINYNILINSQDEDCIFDAQVCCTISKLKKIPSPITCVLGISGGSDSTLALIVVYEAFRRLSLDPKNIIGVTMPCFGTTDRTKNNALNLMKELDITYKEIPIKDSVMAHFNEIGHDLGNKNNTYENAQARMRALTLFDVANDVGGVVIGTGDLSEAWLGWCTYGGDNLSIYNPNGYILKTQVLNILKWLSEEKNYKNEKVCNILMDIYNTPISPELIPGTQESENIIGPYALHDFFISGFLEGWKKEKILEYAKRYFQHLYSYNDIEKWFKVNVSRFNSTQFKRSMKIPAPQANLFDIDLDNFPNDLSI
jgi:NAD+ synthetase